MKVHQSNNNHNTKASFQLCIPLEEPPKRDPNDPEKPIGFSCLRDPTNNDSPKYTIKVFPYEDGQSCEQFLRTKEHFEAIKKGQNITANMDQVILVRQLFKGSAITAFDNALPNGANANITNAAYTRAWKSMTAAVFPNKAGREQKKAMKKIRKPLDMSFRTFANRMKKMNEYLRHFPPNDNGRAISTMEDDEFIEVLHDALPRNGYQDEMQKHDFDPTNGDLQAFIEWIEKRCEPFDKKEPRNPVDQKIPKKKRGRDNKSHGQQPSSKHQKTDKYCMLHGHGNHSTEQCEKLKEIANKEKAERAARNERFKSKSKDFTKNTKDMHLGELEDSESQLSRMIANTVTKTCNQLFKGFKRELEGSTHESHMLEDMSPDNENDAYTNRLNRSTSSDEE